MEIQKVSRHHFPLPPKTQITAPAVGPPPTGRRAGYVRPGATFKTSVAQRGHLQTCPLNGTHCGFVNW